MGNDNEHDNEHNTHNHIHEDSNGNYSYVDDSGNQLHLDVSSNIVITDTNRNWVIDPSQNLVVDSNIVNYSLNQTTDVSGVKITNQQGKNAEGQEVTKSVLLTTLDPSGSLQVTERFTEVVETYDDETECSPNKALTDEIKLYASQINCTDFQGKGTIDDYSALFNAAAQIANESKQMQLNIDVEGFNEFADAADELSQLFTSFIVKLQNVSIIDDTAFLTSIATALKKIVNLANVFGKFKETILATSAIQVPKSAHDTKLVLVGVMDEIECAMQYINYFVNPTDSVPVDATLNASEKAVLDSAVKNIDSWNTLCEQGVSIAMAADPDIQFINAANAELANTKTSLKNATSILRAKFASFNLHQ
jgi:hypothetical protein